VTYLDVEYEEQVVGQAIAEDHANRFSFSYDSAWLDRPNAFSISAHLPLRQAHWPADRAHAFFANLLPEGVAREAICNRLGIGVENDVALLGALGDDTAGALRFTTSARRPEREGRDRQRIERYDRQHTGASVRRFHQEDFCQILDVMPSRKYEGDGGPTLAQIADRLRRLSARPAADLLALVRWVIFSAIGGNADGHAKNLSMLYGANGPQLAPAYDLVCNRAYPKLDHKLAFSIGGERNPDRLNTDNWTRFAHDIGVKPRLVFSQLKKLLDSAEAAFERASEQLRDEVGESHAIQHVSPAVHKRLRAVGAGLPS
jgi:HipA-like protein